MRRGAYPTLNETSNAGGCLTFGKAAAVTAGLVSSTPLFFFSSFLHQGQETSTEVELGRRA